MSKAIIKLYGNIYDWSANSAREMVARLEESERTNDAITLRVHSYGGSVIEGNMIYNALKKCKKPVHAYVDGVAASMASIVIMAAQKIYMAENSFLMIHAPAGSPDGRGTAKEHVAITKVLVAMEKSFTATLMSRTGKDEAAVRAWLDGDTWFSAEEALAQGLIDGIVDPVAKNVSLSPVESLAGQNVEAIYDLYTAELSPKIEQNTNQKTSQMNKELLIKQLGLTGVTAQSTDEQIEAAIIAKHNADQAAIAAANNAVTAQREAEITAEIDSVKGKLTVKQESEYKTIGSKCGIDTLRAALEPFKAQTSITERISSGAASTSSTPGNASWDFDAWQKNDPRGLEKLAKDDPSAFNALYKARFGVDAPL